LIFFIILSFVEAFVVGLHLPAKLKIDLLEINIKVNNKR